MKYTQIPATTFQNIQLNAGILVDSFEPATGTIGSLLGATTGGVQFHDDTEYSDFGEDIDNCPKNTMELKKLDSHDVSMSGTFVTISASTAKKLAAAADVDGEDETHIIPRNDLLMKDFETLWWIGDYSDENTGDNAGFVAIKLFNALNTGGFQIQSTDRGKGQFAFEFTGHYSMDAQDTVPYEIYIREGGEPEPVVTPSIDFDENYKYQEKTGGGGLDYDNPYDADNRYYAEYNETHNMGVVTVPEDVNVTYSSSNTSVATVDNNGTVSVVAHSGTADITASFTYNGQTLSATFYLSVAM